MKEALPVISVVIANYNYGRFLDEAIQSVINQIGKDGANRADVVRPEEVELIVVDGGSTYDSVEIIKKYQDQIAWWVSEPDEGQSEAFNKGFAHAKGEYLTWLNADDLYLPGTLKMVIDVLRRHPHAAWATGNFMRFTELDRRIIQAEWGPHWLPSLFQGRHFPLMIFGPTAFWRRSVYDEIGGIDEKLHYGMDTEYWWRLTVNGYKQVRINHCCWAFRMHEQSKTAEFGTHRNSGGVQKKKTAEYYYFVEKHNVDVRWWGRVLIRLLRILDLSYFRRLWRKMFVVGTQFRLG